VDTWENEDVVFHWPSVVERWCSDDDLREWECPAPSVRITDLMRCAYAAARFEPLVNGQAETDVHSVHLVTLTGADGLTAVLGWTAESRGQAGFEATNQHVCRDREEYAEWLRARGYLDPHDVMSFSPETLLKVWRRSTPPTPRIRTRRSPRR
jgi:hypothetical protein